MSKVSISPGDIFAAPWLRLKVEVIDTYWGNRGPSVFYTMENGNIPKPNITKIRHNAEDFAYLVKDWQREEGS